MSMIIKLGIMILLVSSISVLSADKMTASVYYDFASNTFEVFDEVYDEYAVARAIYSEVMEKKGWDELSIETSQLYDDDIQAYGAGYLEGYLTNNRISSHFKNLYAKTWNRFPNNKMPENVKEYVKSQKVFVEKMYNQYKDDKYWRHAYYIQRQYDGLIEGYNNYSADQNKISSEEMHTISSFGDLFDIVYYKNKALRQDFTKLTLEQMIHYIHKTTHCSALIKVKEDYSDVWFGHTSWFYYSALTRIFKEYKFNFSTETAAKTIHFSSYPAALASMDDFYLTDSDLVVIETTNPMLNQELYDKLSPDSLMTWQRAMIANRLASTALDWTEIFKLNNSGTYNNQFMAIDLKKINTEERKIVDGAMYIAEQIPGTIDVTDVTDYLRYGYWPSYNVPFSNNIRELSNINLALKNNPKLKDVLDYNTCARANIFRRDSGKIRNIEDFKRMLRYNDYKNDPLSKGDPANAIASRIDLQSGIDKCMGAYDAKVVSINAIKGKATKHIHLIAGPSTDQQVVMNWSTSSSCRDEPRLGLQPYYNYSWYVFNSKLKNLTTINSELKFLQ